MNYHVRITQKSNQSHDETKVDLTEEQLQERFVEPYKQGGPILINGKTIPPHDIDRIRISKSQDPSSKIIETIKYEDSLSSVAVIGGPSYKWRAAAKAEDITDEIITGPPGYKAPERTKGSKDIVPSSKRKVFIVHGHDSALKNDIVNFLNEIDLEPIVLHQQPDEGLTVIEKFEKHSDVSFAIILLTPDDVGCLSSELDKIIENKDIEMRARQNVVFEFGYFIGKLGRSKVCCIYKEGVTVPSDLSGLLYKKVKNSIEEIAYGLIKELKNAGLSPKLK